MFLACCHVVVRVVSSPSSFCDLRCPSDHFNRKWSFVQFVQLHLYGCHCKLHKAQAWNILLMSMWDAESGRNQSLAGLSWFLCRKCTGLILHVHWESTQACLHPMTHFHSSFWSPCALKSHQQKLNFWNNFYFSFNPQGRFSSVLLYLDFQNGLMGSLV